MVTIIVRVRARRLADKPMVRALAVLIRRGNDGGKVRRQRSEITRVVEHVWKMGGWWVSGLCVCSCARVLVLYFQHRSETTPRGLPLASAAHANRKKRMHHGRVECEWVVSGCEPL